MDTLNNLPSPNPAYMPADGQIWTRTAIGNTNELRTCLATVPQYLNHQWRQARNLNALRIHASQLGSSTLDTGLAPPKGSPSPWPRRFIETGPSYYYPD